MLKYLFILTITLFTLNVHAQREFSNWYFADYNGLHFPADGSDPIELQGCQISGDGVVLNSTTRHPISSTVSDQNGNLLFYTDGNTIWNRNNQIMQGGDSISESNLFKKIRVVKKPNSNQYYIFNVSSFNVIVDMSLDNGNGGVIIDSLSFTTRINDFINHPDGEFVWLVQCQSNRYLNQLNNTDSLLIYKFTKDGIDSICQEYRIPYTLNPNCKFSHDGKYLAISVNSSLMLEDESATLLSDFDIQNGIVSNPRKIMTPFSPGYSQPFASAYEFNMSSSYLYISLTHYVHPYNGVYQCPLTIDKDTFIHEACKRITPDSFENKPLFQYFSDIRLAPNGKIYLGRNLEMKYDSFISVIHEPELKGDACNLNMFEIKFPNKVSHYFPWKVLPSLYYPIINSKNNCLNEPIAFWIDYAEYDSVKWFFGDGKMISTISDTVFHDYTDSGNYEVKAEIFYNGYSSIILYNIRIYHIPELNLGNDTLICDGSNIEIDVTHPDFIDYLWNDGDSTKQRTMTQEGFYAIEAYTNECKNQDTIFIGFVNCNISTKNVCQGDSAYMELLETEMDSVIWDFGDNLSLKTNSEHIAHLYADSGVYLVKAQIFYKGLSLVLEKTIEVYYVPNDVKLISNPSEGCINLPVNFELQTNYPYKYDFIILFGNGDSTSTIENRPNYNYTYSKEGSFVPILRFRTSNGCFVEVQSDTIKTWEKPKALFTFNPSQPSLDSSQIHFNNQSTGAEFYYWDIQPFGHFEEFEPKVNYTDTGTYPVSLIAENNKGCRDTFISYLIVLPNYRVYLPSAFSPNGDDLNDNFRPIVSGVAEMSFQVFNRWGQMVFMGKDNDTWDGTFNGKPVPEGIYVYSVQVLNLLGEKQSFSGSLTVLR